MVVPWSLRSQGLTSIGSGTCSMSFPAFKPQKCMSGALNPSFANRISDLYFRDLQNHPFWRCVIWRRQHLDEVQSDLVRLLRCAGVVASELVTKSPDQERLPKYAKPRPQEKT